MANDPEPKRLKILTDEIEGRDDDTSSQMQCCGICLVEDGARAAIRGEIDSCDHFFCFVCIMEWAKVESRCPLCKRRFGSIRRPPVTGVFTAHRVVKVAVRDQVYLISGNTTVTPRDPYSNILCSVCNTVGDENLLLLCDLCDSASHTHCVGLGATVPEGDWFCHDCTVSKAEHEKIEADEDSNNQMEQIEHMSIDEIVRDSSLRDVSPRDRITEKNSEINPSVITSAPNFGARTLKRSRNVHARVQALRDNWNAIRSGSVSFTSSSNGLHTNRSEGTNQSHFTSSSNQLDASGSSSCGSKFSKSSHEVEKAWKMMNKAKSIIQTHEKTRTNIQTPKHLLSKINNPFEEARPNSLLVFSSSSSCGPQKHHSFYSCLNANTKTKPQILAKQTRGAESSSRTSCCGESSRLNTDETHKPQLGSKQELGGDSTRMKSCLSDNKLTSRSLRDHESPSSRKSLTSVRDDPCEIVGKLLQKHSPVLPSIPINRCEDHRSKLQLGSKRELGVDRDNRLTSLRDGESPSSRTFFTVRDESCEIGGKMLQKHSSVLPSITISKGEDRRCLPSPSGSFIATSRTSSVTLDSSSSSKMDLPKRKAPEGENFVGHKAREDDPKSDIQVLVKLSLKLLSGDKKLDVKVFKEIARLATHSIMAACGLEQPKPGVHSFPSSVCWHTNQAQNYRRMSTLMHNCCRECFHIFVKDVVNSIMVERIGSA